MPLDTTLFTAQVVKTLNARHLEGESKLLAAHFPDHGNMFEVQASDTGRVGTLRVVPSRTRGDAYEIIPMSKHTGYTATRVDTAIAAVESICSQLDGPEDDEDDEDEVLEFTDRIEQPRSRSRVPKTVRTSARGKEKGRKKKREAKEAEGE